MNKIFYITAILLICFSGISLAQENNYLRITALDNNVDVGIVNNGKIKFVIYYSINGDDNWTEFDTTKTITLTNKNDYICFKGQNSKLSTSGSKFVNFTFSKNVAASGSIMSLIDNVGLTKTIPANYFFCKLFLNCSTLVSAPDLTAETLTQNCYNAMFQGCTALERAPNISATSYAKGCMSYIFSGCSSLKYIEVPFTSWKTPTEETFTTSWVKDVADNGIFISPESLEPANGLSAKPTKWLFNPHKVCLKDISANAINIKNDTLISYKAIVTLKPTKTKGYDIICAAVGKNSNQELELNSNKFTMPYEDVEITITYNPITYNISTEEYVNCEISTATVESDPIPFTVTDRTSEGYELSNVKIGTKTIPIENFAGSFLMSDFAKDVTISATYTPIKYQITKDENISCRKTTATVEDEITFTIKNLTAKGWQLKKVLVNSKEISYQDYSASFQMKEFLCNVNITAEYEPITFTISTEEYITCNTKTATVESEAIAFTVTDRTSEGYELSNVKIGTKTIPIENYAGTFLMSDFAKDVTITATYSAIKYQITKDENITCRKTTATVEDEITFTIKNLTAIGWQPKKVLVNSKEISFQDYSASFKMKDFLCDVNITSEYEPITFTISTEEYITCNTKTATVESEPIPFTVTDRTSEGYELTKVAIGTKTIPFENYAGSFNMSDFVKDVVLTATYSPIKYQITKDENISCRKTTGTVKDTIRFTINDLTSKGYAFKRLFVNGIPRTCQELSDSVIMAKYLCDINLATEYEPITLSITAGEFVNCNTKTATVESEAITFTVTDRTSKGYELSNVKIGTKTIPIENYAGSFLMSDFAKDVTITATYSAIKYQITKDENITCRKTTATVNDSVYFTIKDYSNSGLAVENVLINSKPINYKKEKPGIDMKDFKCDVYISVEYKQLDYKITTDPNITSDHQFASINDLIKINAKDLTSDGYELEKIFVNGSSVTFYKNFSNFLMSEYKSDVEITTQYKPISYKVKAGRYVFTDKNSATVNDTIFFSVDDLSEDGRIFEHILVNGKQIDIKTFNDTIFMSDYISDITIEAVYSKYHSIKTDNNITEISHSTAQKDEQIQFKINPANNGYEPFVYVNSRRIFSPDSINYTFSMFDNDVDIYVDYQEIVVEEPETQEDNQEEIEPEVIKKNRPKAINKIKVYPSLAKEGEIITISLENVDSEYLNNSKIIIFEITGKSIKTFNNPQEINKIIMPKGLYKGVFISGDKKIRFDFAILK